MSDGDKSNLVLFIIIYYQLFPFNIFIIFNIFNIFNILIFLIFYYFYSLNIIPVRHVGRGLIELSFVLLSPSDMSDGDKLNSVLFYYNILLIILFRYFDYCFFFLITIRHGYGFKEIYSFFFILFYSSIIFRKIFLFFSPLFI